MESENLLPKRPQEYTSLIKLIKSETKIRDLKNDNPIKEALLCAYRLVGLIPENYPIGEEKNILHNFILGAYGGLVSKEIVIAFEKAVKHEYSDVDVNCYQNFSCEYFGRIMAAYYVWRQKKLQEQTHKAVTHEQPKFDLTDYYERKLFTPYDEFCKTGVYNFDEFCTHGFYDDLNKLNLLNFSKEEKQAFGSEARLLTPKKKREKITDAEESTASHESRIIKKAKSLAFKSWIEEKSFNETDLRIVINKLS